MERVRLLALLLLMFRAGTMADDVYVDNVKGNDANDGAQATPVSTVAKGLELLKGGDTLHLAPNAEPYCGRVNLPYPKWAGTAESGLDGDSTVVAR
ncbi:hypothetical protein HQ560_20570 [bacterium]|nr:hypothetical protein [bacterium]